MAKLTIEVNLADLSSVKDLERFNKALGSFTEALKDSHTENEKATEKVAKVEVKPESKKAKDQEVPDKEAPAKDAEETEASGPSLQEIRALVSELVDPHREIIKFELKKHKANNVGQLDSKHYQEFYEFLTSLKK